VCLGIHLILGISGYKSRNSVYGSGQAFQAGGFGFDPRLAYHLFAVQYIFLFAYSCIGVYLARAAAMVLFALCGFPFISSHKLCWIEHFRNPRRLFKSSGR